MSKNFIIFKMSWEDNDLIQYQNNFGGNMEMTSVPQGRRRDAERTFINSNNDANSQQNLNNSSIPQSRQRNVQRTYIDPSNGNNSNTDFHSSIPESSRSTPKQTYISPEQSKRSNYTQDTEPIRHSNYTQDSEPIRQTNSTYSRTTYNQRDVPNYYGSMLGPSLGYIPSRFAQPSRVVIRHNTGENNGFNFGQFIRNLNPMLIICIIILIVVLLAL